MMVYVTYIIFENRRTYCILMISPWSTDTIETNRSSLIYAQFKQYQSIERILNNL